ncbi:MAG: hypothetical protein OXC48_01685 [Endozoicomonadaceae bacterium]|nr:hypothetical protein [Endozoicomonadaceae bacterium]
MFKMIKWSIFLCVLSVLLFEEIVQAGLREKQKSSSQDKHHVFQYAKQLTILNVDDGEPEFIQELQHDATTVEILDQQQESWDYSQFNWINVYPFFIKHLSCFDFINATKNRYTVIADLTRALVKTKKSNLNTEIRAKIFIYSALNGLFYHYSENEVLEKSDNAPLLQQLHSALSGKTLRKKMVYHPCKLGDAYESKVLPVVSKHFLGDLEIRNLQLTNKLAELIPVIDKLIDYTRPSYYTSKYFDGIPSTIENLLEQYDDEQHPVILQHLANINDPLKLKKVSLNHDSIQLRSERQLKKLLIKNFNSLWKRANSDPQYLHYLAKVAIFVLHMNPLQSDDGYAAKVAVQSSVSVAVQPSINEGKKINWEKLDLQAAQQVWNNNTLKFLRISLPETITNRLNEKKFFSGNEFTQLPVLPLAAKKNLIAQSQIFVSQDTFLNGLKILLEVLMESEADEHKRIASDIYTQLEAL